MSDMKFFPVFVNHIAPSVQPGDLRHLFSREGAQVIDVLIVSQYGFVNMATEREAHHVIHAINGRRLHSNLIHVDYSEEFKSYLLSRGVSYSCTTDPLTLSTWTTHPLYPSSSQIESPFYSGVGRNIHHGDHLSSLANDPHLVEERLRKVNQELSALNKILPDEPRRLSSCRDNLRHHQHRRRSRSRSRNRSRSRSRSRRESHHHTSSSPKERYHYSPARGEREDGYHHRSGERVRDVREYELFVGGLHLPVSPQDITSLFSGYGQVTKTDLVKNFAFVRLVSNESLVVAACQELSGRTCRHNKVVVSFRKGSRYQHLNEKLQTPLKSKVADDGIVILESSASVEPKCAELPPPVPVATVTKDSPGDKCGDSCADPLGEDFVKNSRQNDELLQSWRSQADGCNSQQYFDGYSFSATDKKTVEEVEEVGPPSPSNETSVSVPGPSFQQPSSEYLRLIMQNVEMAAKSGLSPPCMPSSPPVNEGPRAQRTLHISGLNSRINDFDLKDVFSSYGQVNRVVSKMTYAFIVIISSELSIVKCVCELDGRILKGSKLKVNFARGSPEDSQEFKDKWSEEISGFMSAKHKQSNSGQLFQPAGKVPFSRIGEGLKNIDMSLSLGPLPSLNLPPPIDSIHGTRQQSLREEVNHLQEVEGKIYSVQSQRILLEFLHPFTNCRVLASLIPGQMYINGRQSLGQLIKSNSWPNFVEDFLQIGRRLGMEVRRLSDRGQEGEREGAVQWETVKVWLEGERPHPSTETVGLDDMEVRISSAVIVKLFPTWGLLRSSQGEILFKVNQLHWNQGRLQEEDSIMDQTDLEVGDVVAVQFRRVSLSNISDMIYNIPGGFNLSSTEHLALLVWRVSAELDPWQLYSPPPITEVRFLTTSSTLLRPLPRESEAEHLKVEGEVVQLLLPAGGTVQLTEQARALLGLHHSDSGQVYFHRSRLYLNGCKILPEQRLERELVPGDSVCLDITTNPSSCPFVSSPAAWIALAVRADQAGRGRVIAEKLRRQEGPSSSVVQGRVVHLLPPLTSTGPVTSGVAVLDSGEFMGQRVEFERGVCSAFGFPLHRADLSHLFLFGDRVSIRCKTYNSYCVDSLCVERTDRVDMARWLEDRNISASTFQGLVKGQYEPRRHIPLLTQEVGGQVVELLEDNSGFATVMKILSKAGQVVTADRSRLYVYSHWMGRSDLSYCMLNEHVTFLTTPRYTGHSEAALVWVGGLESRPRYHGQNTEVIITDISVTHLKLWLQAKNMDSNVFQALVEGSLPSRKSALAAVTSGKGRQEMEQKYGSQKIMSSLLSMLNSSSEGDTSPPPPPPGEPPPPPPVSWPSHSTYYSSSSVTASYSSSPQPPEHQL